MTDTTLNELKLRIVQLLSSKVPTFAAEISFTLGERKILVRMALDLADIQALTMTGDLSYAQADQAYGRGYPLTTSYLAVPRQRTMSNNRARSSIPQAFRMLLLALRCRSTATLRVELNGSPVFWLKPNLVKDGGVVIGLIRLDDYSSLAATLDDADLLGTMSPEPKKSGLINRLFGG
jgi:hypothetical protein